MDHIPYPSKSRIPSITIPYCVRSEHIYDGKGFENFAGRIRARWPAPYAVKDEMASKYPYMLEMAKSVAQSWLFFALIEECHILLLPDGPPFERKVYITENLEGTAVLTTTHLATILAAWEAQNRHRDPNGEVPDLRKVNANIELAKGLATGLMELASHLGDKGWIRSSVPRTFQELTLCVYCVGEALSKPGSLHGVFASSLHTRTPAILDDRFQRAGLCLKERHILDNKSFTLKYAASALDRRSDQVTHTHCTGGVCVQDSIDEAEYNLKRCHAPDCDTATCVDVPASAAFIGGPDVTDILRQNCVPVLCMAQSGQTCEISSVPLTNDGIATYVAISHVWSDGLGYVGANEMRICQLRRIQALVNNLYHGCEANIRFWIDTLCVPLEQGARKQALSMMRICYEQADKVLVLDSVLLAVPVVNDPTETFLRIMTCRWRFRLWTLQEAVFARELYFHFADKAITLAYFDDHYNRSYSPLPGEASTSAFTSTTLRTPIRRMHMEPLLSDIAGEIAGLYPIFHGLREPWRIMNRVSTTLEYRTTTKAKDEAICLASLLGIDPSSVARESQESSMTALFASVDKIPLGMLFTSRPRLKTPGYRWAPETLLWRNGSSAYPTFGASCACSEEGLFVALPGFELPLAERLARCDAPQIKVRWAERDILVALVDGEIWADFHDRDRLFVLVSRSISVVTRPEVALLVEGIDVCSVRRIKATPVANLVVGSEVIFPDWILQQASAVDLARELDETQQWQIF